MFLSWCIVLRDENTFASDRKRSRSLSCLIGAGRGVTVGKTSGKRTLSVVFMNPGHKKGYNRLWLQFTVDFSHFSAELVLKTMLITFKPSFSSFSRWTTIQMSSTRLRTCIYTTVQPTAALEESWCPNWACQKSSVPLQHLW